VRKKKKGKSKSYDVWLITNVLDPKRLSLAQASKFYRWRWENEMSQPDDRSSDRLYLARVAA